LVSRSIDSKEFRVFVATTYGEANTGSETAWRAVGNVIMNRVGSGIWKEYNTVESVISNTGFDAYTQKNSPYLDALAVLNGDSKQPAWRKQKVERMRELLAPIYLGTEPDITSGAVNYYSPKAQADWHKRFPKKYTSAIPKWKWNTLQQVSIPNLESTDDFRFYKLK